MPSTLRPSAPRVVVVDTVDVDHALALLRRSAAFRDGAPVVLVLRGDVPSVLFPEAFRERHTSPAPCHVPELTSREQEVVRLAVRDLSAKQIAAHLGIGVRTVETHLDHAYRKFGVRSRAELRDAIDLAAAS